MNDFLSTNTPIKHHKKTPFIKNLNPKCDQFFLKTLPNFQTSI
jgi:hypothetical protein